MPLPNQRQQFAFQRNANQSPSPERRPNFSIRRYSAWRLSPSSRAVTGDYAAMLVEGVAQNFFVGLWLMVGGGLGANPDRRL